MMMDPDIPDDVIQQARALFVAVFKIEHPSELLRIASGELDDMPMLVIAANSIASEREACAKVAESRWNDASTNIGAVIAKAIRTRGAS